MVTRIDLSRFIYFILCRLISIAGEVKMIRTTKGREKLRKMCVLLKMTTRLRGCLAKRCWKTSIQMLFEISRNKNTVLLPKALEKPTSFVTICLCFVVFFSFLPFRIYGKFLSFFIIIVSTTRIRNTKWKNERWEFILCYFKGMLLLATSLLQNLGNPLDRQSNYFIFS